MIRQDHTSHDDLIKAVVEVMDSRQQPGADHIWFIDHEEEKALDEVKAAWYRNWEGSGGYKVGFPWSDYEVKKVWIGFRKCSNDSKAEHRKRMGLLVTAPMLLFAVGVTAATFGWLWWV